MAQTAPHRDSVGMAIQTPTTAPQSAHAALDAAKPLHIFKAGRHTAMSGASLQFSESDLAASAAAYDPALHEAPLVIGHPKHDMPAYGWVKAVSFSDGDIDHDAGMYATPAQVNADFADMVAAGAFKKISASFYPPNAPSNPVPGVYYLRHVGFLGAQPPAIKGLAQVAFADGDDNLTFAEWDIAAPTTDPTAAAAAPAAPADQSAQHGQATTTPNLEDIVTPEEKAALEAENLQLRAQLAATNAAQVHAANVAFAEGLVTQGRLLPAYTGVIAATLDHFATQEAVVEFGEGEAKAPLVDQLKAMLTAAPKLVEFGEHATQDKAAEPTAPADDDIQFGENTDPARLAQHKAIKAHAAQHKVDYVTAARAVIR